MIRGSKFESREKFISFRVQNSNLVRRVQALREYLSPKTLILLSLKQGPRTPQEIIEETKLARNTVFYHLKELLSQGLVAKKDGKYVLTDMGKEVLKKVVEVVG